jgi:hypothetical protein
VATAAQRRSDTQLIVVTVGLLVGAAALVAVGLLVATDRADSPRCALQLAGEVRNLTRTIEEGGPILQTGGDGCAYWVDLAGGELVAYRVQPRGRDCVVDARTNRELVTTYSCGGERLGRADLDRYPTWHPVDDGLETLLVDLRPDRPCDAYELGVATALDDRVRDGGAVLVDVPDCGRFWLAPDQSDVATPVVTRTDDCRLDRDATGDLRCGDDVVDAGRVPGYPTTHVERDGEDRLVVDLTAHPS